MNESGSRLLADDTRLHTVLLPGLDGTGLLFGPLLDAAPESFSAQVVRYPGRLTTYPEIERYVWQQMPRSGPFLLVAESFSGPIAVRLASHRPEGLVGVVLAASFASRPIPSCLPAPDALLRPALLRSRLARLALLGPGPPQSLDALVRRALGSVPAETLARRVREVLRVDVTDALRSVNVPIAYLQPTRDLLIGRRASRLLCREKPSVEVVGVAGPHLILQHSPASSWEAISRFVRTALPAASVNKPGRRLLREPDA